MQQIYCDNWVWVSWIDDVRKLVVMCVALMMFAYEAPRPRAGEGARQGG
jgi:hypothetical protein